MIQGAPPDVVKASQLLSCSTCALVNIGVNREDLSKAHMTYFYDEDICFSRLGFPHMLTARNAPPGTGSIQAEVYFSDKYKPFTGTPDAWIEPVIRDPPALRSAARLRQNTVQQNDASALCERDFRSRSSCSSETVHGYLDDLGIAYCGRYGDWGYMWTDESFKSGEQAAEKAFVHAMAASF